MFSNASHTDSLSCGLDDIDQFDEIIDVRTPAEYADDHIPGAVNAPVLNNEERQIIGTMYSQESPFKATRLGAALVARHIADHLESSFASRPRNWRPLVYCWRGGKRSGAMTTWLHQIGWRARQLDGGYKTWRRHVIGQLDALPATIGFIVLAGPTGSGKTRLLQALGTNGAQILDLEAIACHRGSLLGELPHQAQPSQRCFETRLYQHLKGLNPARPVFVEAESRRIGRLNLPDTLLQSMRAGRCIRVQASLDERTDFLLQDYRHLFDNPEWFKTKLQYLTGLHSRKTITQWQELIDQNRRAELFRRLMLEHYDPAYLRSSQSHFVHLAKARVFNWQPCGADPNLQAMALLDCLSRPQSG